MRNITCFYQFYIRFLGQAPRLTRIVFRGDDYEITTAFGGFELRSVVDFKGWDKSHKLGGIIKVGWELEDAKVFPIEMKKDIIKYG